MVLMIALHCNQTAHFLECTQAHAPMSVYVPRDLQLMLYSNNTSTNVFNMLYAGRIVSRLYSESLIKVLGWQLIYSYLQIKEFDAGYINYRYRCC